MHPASTAASKVPSSVDEGAGVKTVYIVRHGESTNNVSKRNWKECKYPIPSQFVMTWLSYFRLLALHDVANVGNRSLDSIPGAFLMPSDVYCRKGVVWLTVVQGPWLAISCALRVRIGGHTLLHV